MVVYVDLLFLTNVFFDAAIIVATARLRGLRLRIWRTATAAALGGLYVVFMFEPSASLLYTSPAKLIFSLAAVFVAFGYGGLQTFGKNVGMFYVVHFTAAGALFAFHFVLLSSGETLSRLLLQPTGSVAFLIDSGLWLSFPVFVASLVLCRSVFTAQVRSATLQTAIAEVRVDIAGHFVRCHGLVDTGNQLYDPLSRMPVMVMESNMFRDLLPAETFAAIRSKQVERFVANLSDNSFPWPERLRLVPYRGVNVGSRFMLALKPDKVIIETGEGRYESSRVLIALDGGRLAAGGEYEAIVHPLLVQS